MLESWNISQTKKQDRPNQNVLLLVPDCCLKDDTHIESESVRQAGANKSALLEICVLVSHF